MSNLSLLQSESDALIALEKVKIDETLHDFPVLGGVANINLISRDGRENFVLDIRRGRIDLKKATFQNRYRQTTILVRVDISGPPHRNPDGVEIPSPHIHIYREGFGDKWAEPIPTSVFKNTNDLWQTLEDFFAFCNITKPPNFNRGLF